MKPDTYVFQSKRHPGKFHHVEIKRYSGPGGEAITMRCSCPAGMRWASCWHLKLVCLIYDLGQWQDMARKYNLKPCQTSSSTWETRSMPLSKKA